VEGIKRLEVENAELKEQCEQLKKVVEKKDKVIKIFGEKMGKVACSSLVGVIFCELCEGTYKGCLPVRIAAAEKQVEGEQLNA
jgi:hypothetical protein